MHSEARCMYASRSADALQQCLPQTPGFGSGQEMLGLRNSRSSCCFPQRAIIQLRNEMQSHLSRRSCVSVQRDPEGNVAIIHYCQSSSRTCHTASRTGAVMLTLFKCVSSVANFLKHPNSRGYLSYRQVLLAAVTRRLCRNYVFDEEDSLPDKE